MLVSFYLPPFPCIVRTDGFNIVKVSHSTSGNVLRSDDSRAVASRLRALISTMGLAIENHGNLVQAFCIPERA